MNKSKATFIARFLKMESSGGILLMAAALTALVLANTPLASYYALLIDTPVEIRIGAFEIAKPLLLWINDGLMAVFFFLIGLELKRELKENRMTSSPSEKHSENHSHYVQ
jgi:NhaA family Na+:H+ antiporter